jgi:DNA-binding transcriptional regulator GbsR (MarR family)
MFIQLLNHYQNGDYIKFQHLFNEKKEHFTEEKFFLQYFRKLFNQLKKKSILDIISSYSRIRLNYISNELNIDIKEIEIIIGQLILDKQVFGNLNQINGTFDISNEKNDFSIEIVELIRGMVNIHSNICGK